MTVQNLGDYDIETGLEDFDVTDAVIPRISILHREGKFQDSLTKEEFGSLKVVILGLVKQRILWHPGMEDDDSKPMCRSNNHDIGFPNDSDEQPKAKRFPWDKSAFDKADNPPDDDGLTRLPCSGCQLKEWGSHPDGKKPYCSEQFTLPIFYDPRDDGDFLPAIITFQKTALKPLKAYLSSFHRARGAAFQAVTEITLDLVKMGQNPYSVPIFKRIGDTPEELWREYSVNYRSIRDYLTADPGSRDETEETTPAVAESKPPAEEKTPEPTTQKEEPKIEEKAPEPTPEPEAKPEPAAEPATAAADDDDLPF